MQTTHHTCQWVNNPDKNREWLDILFICPAEGIPGSSKSHTGSPPTTGNAI